jgi:hypothetical protein
MLCQMRDAVRLSAWSIHSKCELTDKKSCLSRTQNLPVQLGIQTTH